MKPLALATGIVLVAIGFVVGMFGLTALLLWAVLDINLLPADPDGGRAAAVLITSIFTLLLGGALVATTK